MKCRLSLTYRDLEEIAIIRGAKIDHVTFAKMGKLVPLIDNLVRKRKKPVGSSGEWTDLYQI